MSILNKSFFRKLALIASLVFGCYAIVPLSYGCTHDQCEEKRAACKLDSGVKYYCDGYKKNYADWGNRAVRTFNDCLKTIDCCAYYCGRTGTCETDKPSCVGIGQDCCKIKCRQCKANDCDEAGVGDLSDICGP